MARHSVNNNTRMGLIFLCSNSNHLISLIPPYPGSEVSERQRDDRVKKAGPHLRSLRFMSRTSDPG